ncbi:MAG: tetratricopeptide repeat protein [Vicinamibacterales bacterium]
MSEDQTAQELAAHLASAAELRQAGKGEEAWSHLIAAETICRSTGRRRDLVITLAGLAQLHRDGGDTASAAPLYDEAVTHARQLGDRHLLAHAMRHLGEVQVELRAFDRAQQLLRDALDLYRGHPATDALDLANAVRPLALCLERQGAGAEALPLWIEARELYASLGIDAGVAECARAIARLGGETSA